jgi:dipeptidyl-peptidase-4
VQSFSIGQPYRLELSMNRQSIALALTFSLVVICPSFAEQPDASILTVERIFSTGDFATESFGPARWLEDGSGYVTLEPSQAGAGRDIVRYNPADGSREIMVNASRLIPLNAKEPLAIADYAWSKDATKLLIFTNTRKVWRLHTRGDYWVLDLRANSLRKLGGSAPEATLMFAKFSPDGRQVAFVREFNLYVENLENNQISPLTTGGSPTLINGTFDWVYEEEFSLHDGFRWSPDGTSIAFWQIDTSGMKDFNLINNTDSLYPELTPIRYPKVGQTNPSSRVGVVPVSGGDVRWIELPGDARDHYIARMSWAANSDEIVLQRLNRLQNTNEVVIADVHTSKARTKLTEHDDTWVDVGDDIHFMNEGQKFSWLSERNGWNQLFVAPREGGAPKLVTPGAYDVIDLIRVDDREGVADFIASPENPTQRLLYRVRFDDPENRPRRLTPEDQPGTHSYQVSPNGRWAFHTYSTFEKPPVIELISLPDHKVVRTLVDNAKLRTKLEALKKTPAEFFRVDVGDGVVMDGWCMKPPDFDPSKRYPLVIHVYGEPAGVTVVDQWGGSKALWHRMLAQLGYVVISLDNRGTPAPRGRGWRKSIYRQVGILASHDQAEALKALKKKWPFIDGTRVGIWGWSGGGSMSLNAIFRYPELYRTAIAVAFISDQTLYDTIYQERYMGLPKDNPGGYRDGSPITFADRLQGNLLLIHGTGDDNCHYQSCERLVNKLISLNKPFSMMAYPNRSHGIYEGANTSRHLYELMTRYIQQNLPVVEKN